MIGHFFCPFVSALIFKCRCLGLWPGCCLDRFGREAGSVLKVSRSDFFTDSPAGKCRRPVPDARLPGHPRLLLQPCTGSIVHGIAVVAAFSRGHTMFRNLVSLAVALL